MAIKLKLKKLFAAHKKSAPRTILILGGSARIWSISNADQWDKFRDEWIAHARNDYKLVVTNGMKYYFGAEMADKWHMLEHATSIRKVRNLIGESMQAAFAMSQANPSKYIAISSLPNQKVLTYQQC